MSIQEPVVNIKVKARFLGTPLEDPLVVAAVRAAVKRYSRYNPLLVQDTLDLVAGEAIYSLPEDFLALYEFSYWPAGEPTVSWTSDSLWDRAYKAILEDAKASELSPFVEVVAQQLLVKPVPDADEQVDYTYFAVHAVDDTTGDYATIPHIDEGIIVDLATAELLLSSQPDISLDEDFAEGLLQVRGRDRVANITDTVRALRRGVIEKYGGY